jgi:hypothetical protein
MKILYDKPFISNWYVSLKKRRFTMKLKERSKVIATVTAMDVYRCIILGLVGTFYGFLVFLMFV